MSTYGPNTTAVEALLAQLATLTVEQWETAREYVTTTAADPIGLDVRRSAPRAAADAAALAGRTTEFSAAKEAAWDRAPREVERISGLAADAATALVVADLLEADFVEALTAPLRAVGVTF